MAELDTLVNRDTASNMWVISGEHTTTGKPLLASDPHLTSQIPGFWQLQELIFGERYISGASLPGVPGIVIGRSPDVTWGVTAPTIDNSDLWEEELNEAGTHYLVNGKWRELQIREEAIKVKG